MQLSRLLYQLDRIVKFQCSRRYISNQFVPKHQPVGPEDVQKLEDFLRDKQNVLVLTGAGISTESGTLSKIIITNESFDF